MLDSSTHTRRAMNKSGRPVSISYARKFLTAALVALLAFAPLSSKAQATGDCVLDTTFDRDGKLTTYVNGFGYPADAAVQSDGKIVVTGWSESPTGFNSDFTTVRYNPNGSLDTGFGNGGKAITDFGSGDQATALVIQPDGKIIVSGQVFNLGNSFDFALVRYNPDGSLDNSFGNNGKVTTDFGESDTPRDVALQPDGKIVQAGYVSHNLSQTNNSSDFALVRYNKDGSLDTSFGDGGKLLTDFSGGDGDGAEAVVIQRNGKIVAAGYALGASFGFALVRYNKDGSLDSSFGNGGKVLTVVGLGGGASSLILLPNQKIVAVGSVSSNGSYLDFALARYNGNGSLDTSFGTGGTVTTDFFGKNDFAHDAVLRPDGKIVVVGTTFTDPNVDPLDKIDADFALARYNSDGTPDTSFDTDGKLNTDFFHNEDFGYAVALQPDGKVVAVGAARNVTRSTNNVDFALARYPAELPSFDLPHLVSVELNGSRVTGCRALIGTVKLCGPAPPGGLEVSLRDSLAAVSVPSSVIVPAGETTAAFTITTISVPNTVAGNIVAKLGPVVKSAPLILLPVGVAVVTLEQDTVTGPATIHGGIFLSCPAPDGGITVMLSSRSPAIASPTVSQITFPAGSISRSFTVRVADVSSPRTVVIQATANGIGRSKVLTVQ